jgi:SAM-dependent methyltransferase
LEPTPGAATFKTSADAYDSFMGRYSKPLAIEFADFASVTAGQVALDVGCGPGALTRVLVGRLGEASVSAFDPSEQFVAECRAACPGVDVRLGRAEAIPFDDASFDTALAQLVLHFVSEPHAAAMELRRVVRPGGLVAACVWDFDGGMQMLRYFWDAALAVDAGAPDETRRFGREGEIAALFVSAGMEDVKETTLQVLVGYETFEDLWTGYLAGIGPAGSYCTSLEPDKQARLEGELFRRVGSPPGAFELSATAHAVRATTPSG